MSSKWTGPVVEPGKGLNQPVNWRALLLRSMGTGAVLIGVAVYSVFGPGLFERGEPQDWQERTVAGLQFSAPAPLVRDSAEKESGRGVETERYSDGRKSLAVTVFHLRLALPVSTPEQHFDAEEKSLRSALESVAKSVVCYPKDLTVSGMPARRFVCTGDADPSFLQIESLVVSNGLETWKVAVRYQPTPFNGRETAAKRVLESVVVAGK